MNKTKHSIHTIAKHKIRRVGSLRLLVLLHLGKVLLPHDEVQLHLSEVPFPHDEVQLHLGEASLSGNEVGLHLDEV
uniref:Uncharacterized protein n=1 Tax=Candidatus Kentrum sp. SD TaxID=2126332 RepID=A0A450Z2Z9_9GAMM|nr:MAG: hypothetical protein BECKSD772F_GA0070984_11352 [Candidatus Kentron sp. SD]VFK48185.1 MAG: hypothetical protein BECKSD772E_GA0070983_11162 [Candidatus Kentron sp. SD]